MQTTETAISRLVEKAKTDTKLRDHLIYLGACQYVRSELTKARKPYISSDTRREVDPPISEIVLPNVAAQQAKKLFMEQYFLYGGQITLADATQVELGNAARQHDTLAKGNTNEAAFLRAVGKILPKGKRVKEVFSGPEGDAKLREMKKSFGGTTVVA